MSTETVAVQMGASSAMAQQIESAVIEYNIESELEKSHFLGQMSVESNGFKTLVESLNYGVPGLLVTFGRHRITTAQAKQYGRSPGNPANQQMLGNILYGGAFGRDQLGNIEVGDGYKFRGRGLKHLTGRYNYKMCSLALFGDLRLLDKPEILEQPVYAAKSAAWFWTRKSIKPVALRDNVTAVTRVVNGGSNGLADRIAATDTAKQLFKNIRSH